MDSLEGDPWTEAMGLREVGVTRQLFKKEVFFSLLILSDLTGCTGKSERHSNPCPTLQMGDPEVPLNHWVSTLSYLPLRVTEVLASKCSGNIKSRMLYVAL